MIIWQSQDSKVSFQKYNISRVENKNLIGGLKMRVMQINEKLVPVILTKKEAEELIIKLNSDFCNKTKKIN